MIALFNSYRLKFINSDIGLVLTNAFWLIQARFLNIAISFFVGLYTIRYFGPEKFGRFSYAYAIIGFFTVLIGFGMKEVVIKELAKNRNNQDVILGNTILIQILIASLSTLITFLILYFTNEKDHLIWQIVTLLTVTYFFTPFLSVGFLFEAELLGKKVAYLGTISLLISSLLKILVIVFKGGLLLYCFVGILETFFNVILFLFVLKKNKYRIRLKWKTEWIVSILKQSTPIALAGLSIWMYMRFDQILIRQMSNLYQNGIYATSVRLTEAIYFIPMVIQSSFLGKLTIEKTKSVTRYRRMLVNMIRVQLISSISLCFIFLIIVNTFIIHFLSTAFEPVRYITLILVFNVVFIAVGIARTTYMYVNNLTHLQLPITIICLTINLLLNVLLIPKYGAIGSSVAILITQIIAGLAFPFVFKKLRPFNYFLIRSLSKNKY